MTRRRFDSTRLAMVRVRFEWGLFCVETGQGGVVLMSVDSDIYLTHCEHASFSELRVTERRSELAKLGGSVLCRKMRRVYAVSVETGVRAGTGNSYSSPSGSLVADLFIVCVCEGGGTDSMLADSDSDPVRRHLHCHFRHVQLEIDIHVV